MMRLYALVAAAWLPFSHPAQSAAVQPFHVDDPGQHGRAMRVVEPVYPSRALAGGRSGYVEISGRVSPLGRLEQIAYSADKPASGVFIDPVRRVIHSWSFQPPLDSRCRPSTQRVTNRVHFQVENGQPRIQVLQVAPGVGAPPGRTIAVLHREEPLYPPSLRGNRAEAIVYARMQVDATGQVISVEPRAHAAQARRSVREFKHEVIRALTQWRFPPVPDATPNRFVCLDVRFTPGD